jgi:quercetin dioxygenase-like cupin family protein
LGNPVSKLIAARGVQGTLYTFAKSGDVLPMHDHDAGADHISIVAHGSFELRGLARIITVAKDAVIDFKPNQPHEFVALEDGAVLVNIVKGSAA